MIKHRVLHCTAWGRQGKDLVWEPNTVCTYRGVRTSTPQLQEMLLLFNSLFVTSPGQSRLLGPTVSYGHYIQVLSKWIRPSGETNILAMWGSSLPVIRLLKPIIISRDCWNYLGIPCPQATDPKLWADLCCSCRQSTNSSSKADSTWVISERAKEQNYRLSGKGWKMRTLEGKKPKWIMLNSNYFLGSKFKCL